MIRPSKHSHPDQTVIFVSLSLLEILRTRRLESYEKLRAKTKRLVTGGDVLFLPALNLLYLLGLIDYQQKTDSIEYLGPDENIAAIQQQA